MRSAHLLSVVVVELHLGSDTNVGLQVGGLLGLVLDYLVPGHGEGVSVSPVHHHWRRHSALINSLRSLQFTRAGSGWEGRSVLTARAGPEGRPCDFSHKLLGSKTRRFYTLMP